MVTIAQAKQRILNKWDWHDNDNNYPVILWGAPGLGKTSLIYSLVCERMISEAEKAFVDEVKEKKLDKESKEYVELHDALNKKIKLLNFSNVTHELMEAIEKHCLVLRLAERPIEQLQGVIVPSMSEKDNVARFVMPENLLKVRDSDWGIIFLDELDKASDSKFGAATHILENRIVGDMHLGKGWFVIAAANREEDSHLSNPIPPELRNRCANIEVEPDLKTWIDWAVTHGVRKDIILFHKFNNGEWLSKYDVEESYSFPTPRSWTMASTIIDRIESKLNLDKTDSEAVKKFDNIIRHELVDFVGKQAQSEFYTYRELYVKFNIKEILEGKERISLAGSTDEQTLISDQCVAAFAMADQVGVDMLLTEKKSEANGFKATYNELHIKNLVQFIGDLLPEIRAIYLRQIHTTNIMNLIMDSGLAEDSIDELIKYIAT